MKHPKKRYKVEKVIKNSKNNESDKLTQRLCYLGSNTIITGMAISKLVDPTIVGTDKGMYFTITLGGAMFTGYFAKKTIKSIKDKIILNSKAEEVIKQLDTIELEEKRRIGK